MDLRSNERQQLLDMLPTAVERHEELDDKQAAETVSEAIEQLEESGTLDMDEDALKQILMSLSMPDVQNKHGRSRTMWLIKKLTYRVIEGGPVRPVIPRGRA